MVFIHHAVTQQQPSSPQQQPAGAQHQLLSSATGHQPQFGNNYFVPMHVPICIVGVLAIDDHLY